MLEWPGQKIGNVKELAFVPVRKGTHAVCFHRQRPHRKLDCEALVCGGSLQRPNRHGPVEVIAGDIERLLKHPAVQDVPGTRLERPQIAERVGNASRQTVAAQAQEPRGRG